MSLETVPIAVGYAECPFWRDDVALEKAGLFGSDDFIPWAKSQFTKRELTRYPNGEHLLECSLHGYLQKGAQNKLIDTLHILGFTQLYLSEISSFKKKSVNDIVLLVRADAALLADIDFRDEHESYVHCVTVNNALSCTVFKQIRPMLRPKDTTQNSKKAYVLATDSEGRPTFASSGIGAVQLVPENYTEKAINGYNEVIEDLYSTDPMGRLALLEGPTGTGKTYMTQGMLSEITGAVFIYIPSHAVSSLAEPHLVTLLLKKRKRLKQDNPIVFIVEDADLLLVPRQIHDNMGSVAAMLNLTDGVLGKALNLRFVVTTNARVAEIDKALLRPGRMTARVYVGNLDSTQPNKIYRRVSGESRDIAEPFEEKTLAQVYFEAKSSKRHHNSQSKENLKIATQR